MSTTMRRFLLRWLVLVAGLPVFISACRSLVCPECGQHDYGCFGGPNFVERYFFLPIGDDPLFFGAISGVVLLVGVVSELVWAWRDAMDRRRAQPQPGPRQLDLFSDETGDLQA